MIAGLDHINVETRDLDTSVRFYEDLLGLKPGWRPSFDVAGAWLYANDEPIVHLVLRDEPGTGPTGAIHHVALKANDLPGTRERIDAMGLDYRETRVPDLDVTQLFLVDPNGVRIELNFYESSVD